MLRAYALQSSYIQSAREHAGEKPFSSDGYENCQWIAMDYGHVIVHVFQPEFREFYDIEHLWADANITMIPDLD